MIDDGALHLEPAQDWHRLIRNGLRMMEWAARVEGMGVQPAGRQRPGGLLAVGWGGSATV